MHSFSFTRLLRSLPAHTWIYAYTHYAIYWIVELVPTHGLQLYHHLRTALPRLIHVHSFIHATPFGYRLLPAPHLVVGFAFLVAAFLIHYARLTHTTDLFCHLLPTHYGLGGYILRFSGSAHYARARVFATPSFLIYHHHHLRFHTVTAVAFCYVACDFVYLDFTFCAATLICLPHTYVVVHRSTVTVRFLDLRLPPRTTHIRYVLR